MKKKKAYTTKSFESSVHWAGCAALFSSFMAIKKINVFRITTDKCIINWSRVQILSYKFSPSACPVLAEPAVEVSTRFGLLCFRLYFRKGGQPVTNAGCQPTCWHTGIEAGYEKDTKHWEGGPNEAKFSEIEYFCKYMYVFGCLS